MQTKILLCVLSLLVFFSLPSEAFAAKKRVRAARAVGIAYSSARLSRGTNSVVITFKNLAKVKRVEYTLSYSANGISQGVVGSFVPGGGADSRDLYFGTCSKGVCTPHYGIANATLTVTTVLSSGATHTKRYIIKRV